MPSHPHPYRGAGYMPSHDDLLRILREKFPDQDQLLHGDTYDDQLYGCYAFSRWLIRNNHIAAEVWPASIYRSTSEEDEKIIFVTKYVVDYESRLWDIKHEWPEDDKDRAVKKQLLELFGNIPLQWIQTVI
ncbi:hypothetical protein FISHEDRAFT_69141 [Fistulina hepatica ATCC 64428]|uniref:Uncharacterized protein n=1 Tax=Fistulina hepatica ATCC 64428 TaxID=1128425 RepID=A0A0D7AN54_9AGAR|nr:hypothetical protein FISHEDRAFT_69141 [Fistulina hepatica ATCC 64428]